MHMRPAHCRALPSQSLAKCGAAGETFRTVMLNRAFETYIWLWRRLSTQYIGMRLGIILDSTTSEGKICPQKRRFIHRNRGTYTQAKVLGLHKCPYLVRTAGEVSRTPIRDQKGSDSDEPLPLVWAGGELDRQAGLVIHALANRDHLAAQAVVALDHIGNLVAGVHDGGVVAPTQGVADWGRETSASSRIRYMATWRGRATSRVRSRPIRCSVEMPKAGDRGDHLRRVRLRCARQQVGQRELTSSSGQRLPDEIGEGQHAGQRAFQLADIGLHLAGDRSSNTSAPRGRRGRPWSAGWRCASRNRAAGYPPSGPTRSASAAAPRA